MKTITVETVINAPIEKVWEFWVEPKHIVKWCFASEDWEAPRAENDLRVDGKFNTRMSARDGSSGFDFEGVYTDVRKFELLEYKIADGRTVSISFNPVAEGIKIVEVFEMEDENSEELQRSGWQAILNNFKKYVENN